MPGLLEAPAFLCPLILSFRASNLAEAWLPRRTLLGSSVHRGSLRLSSPAGMLTLAKKS